MKKLITITLGMLMIGCGSIERRNIQRSSTADLQLRRYQAMSRLSGPHYFSGRAFDDGGVSDDTNEKEAIERELMRRGAIDYQSAPHVTYW
jgi:hypothetical protein